MTAKVRDMTLLIKTLTAVAAGTMLATSAFAQSVRVQGSSAALHRSRQAVQMLAQIAGSRTNPQPN
jgi:hypothetical protein